MYLGGNYYDALSVYVKENGIWKLHHIHRDYLGSITHITDNTGNLTAEYSYDAWGRLRNPGNQSVYTPGNEPELFLGRGYTGHEHLPFFGLINMNARLYDPVLGRFLSPDPYVPYPQFSLNYNRYLYALNNPFSYIDEDGEVVWTVIIGAAVIAGAINVYTNWEQIKTAGGGFKSFLSDLGYFGIGAVAGGVGAYTGFGIAGALGGLSGVAGGVIVGAGSGAVSGFIMGGGNAALQGKGLNGFLDGAAAGAFTGAIGGAVSGAAAGEVTSYIQGKNVWTGSDLEAGRSPFAIKNTPIQDIGKQQDNTPAVNNKPNDLSPSSQPEITNKPLTPYEKGQQGVQRAIEEFRAEGGVVHQKEVSIKIDGVRNVLDFVSEKDNLIYLFEIKNGPTAPFTTNQKINLPKLLLQQPNFIPRGENAANVPGFKHGIPYTKNILQ